MDKLILMVELGHLCIRYYTLHMEPDDSSTRYCSHHRRDSFDKQWINRTCIYRRTWIWLAGPTLSDFLEKSPIRENDLLLSGASVGSSEPLVVSAAALIIDDIQIYL